MSGSTTPPRLPDVEFQQDRTESDNDPSSIWATQPRTTSSQDDIFKSIANQANSLRPSNTTTTNSTINNVIADLDPFAPSTAPSTSSNNPVVPPRISTTTATATTLGQQMRSSNSLLELIPPSPSDPSNPDGGNGEPPSPASSFQLLGQEPSPPPIQTEQQQQQQQSQDKGKQKEKKPKPTTLSLSPSTTLSSFGGMLRSLSGSGGAGSGASTPTKAGSTPTTEKDGEREWNEKTGTGGKEDGEKEKEKERMGIPNPLTSLASAFKNASIAVQGTGSGLASGSGSGSNTGEKEEDKEKEKRNSREKEKDREEPTFDFNRFLEQMRLRSADPIAKYLRSFLKEFSRKPPHSTSDQIKVINDFLDFIADKMRLVEPWKSMVTNSTMGNSGGGEDGEVGRGELEFDMSMEAMEKLVMNRLWHLTFSPAVDLANRNPPTDDLERDNVLSQRIRLFSWVEPRHLDLVVDLMGEGEKGRVAVVGSGSGKKEPEEERGKKDAEGDGDGQGETKKVQEKPAVSDSSIPPIRTPTPNPSPTPALAPSPSITPAKTKRATQTTQGFIDFATRELNKINSYKAPRDKMICVLNACKVIFGLIRHVSSEEGADAFVPFLIYVVLKANPDHLVSNLQYIQRFRNPEKLQGEGGYYLSSLNGAISFIETMDASHLSHITQQEFETNVEQAILRLPVDPADASLRLPKTPTRNTFAGAGERPSQSNTPEPPHSDIPLPPVPAAVSGPAGGAAAAKQLFIRGSDSVERAISKPLGAIGRIFEQLETQLGGETGSASSGAGGGEGAGTGGASRNSAPPALRGGTGVERPGIRQGRRSYAHPSPAQGQLVDASESGRTEIDPNAGMYAPDRMTPGQVEMQIEQQRLATLGRRLSRVYSLN
ncbi:hypothetical protein T439DRAFT_326091 [Meredithblackwellia eburnea MCA 4105]